MRENQITLNHHYGKRAKIMSQGPKRKTTANQIQSELLHSFYAGNRPLNLFWLSFFVCEVGDWNNEAPQICFWDRRWILVRLSERRKIDISGLFWVKCFKTSNYLVDSLSLLKIYLSIEEWRFQYASPYTLMKALRIIRKRTLTFEICYDKMSTLDLSAKGR